MKRFSIRLGLLLALLGALVLARVPEAFAGSSGGGGKHFLAAHPRLNTAPSASETTNA
ncbi:MAG: hypothetical protein ACR2PL_07905 [Dehalococcoidia bacterium]